MSNNLDEFQEKRKRGYVLMRMIYDLGMATIILAMAIILLFGSFFGLDKFIQLDPLLKYIFGSVCLLYGAFRLYRGIKRDY